VIPERASVTEREAIRERVARFDWALDHIGAIHRRRQAQAVPMENSWLRKVIGESQLQDIANTHFDHRPGDLTVEAPRFGGDTRCELPVDLSSLEVDLDNAPIRVWYRGVVCLRVRSKRVTRDSMDSGSMPVCELFLSVVVMMV
jgi:hypothetical protein